MNRMHRTTLVSATVFGGLLLVGCDYFSDVVVPANDSNPPSPVGRLIHFNDDGSDDYFGFYAGDIEVETNDLDDTFYAIASGIDSGGVHEVTLYHSARAYCRLGSYEQQIFFNLAPKTETVEAAVGDTVENGLWVGHAFNMHGFDSCSTGFTLTKIVYSWSTLVEDFHSNSSSMQIGTVTYTP